MPAASPSTATGEREGRPVWSLPARARILVVAGVLVAAAGVFVAVFWVHGVSVPLCRGGRAGCDAVRRDERLVIRALVVAAGVAWAAGMGYLAMLASRPGRPGWLRPGRVAGTEAGRPRGAAHARGR